LNNKENKFCDIGDRTMSKKPDMTLSTLPTRSKSLKSFLNNTGDNKL
jgi:hypothetical protein